MRVGCGFFLIFRAHKKMQLQTIPVKRTIEHDFLGKVRGTKDQPTDRRTHALSHDFSTLTREKCHGSSRPDPHDTRISRVTRIVASRVGSGRVRKISKPRGSGRVRSGQEVFKISRVGSGRVKRLSKPRGSGRVGSGGFQITRVGSGRVKTPRNSRGSGRVRTSRNFTGRVGSADQTRPDPTREM